MATTVSMPQLGETVTEGTILKWAKQVGDNITEDEVLVEISTDKVDTEVPSPVAGTILEILVPEGETVEVGTSLVVIGDEGESIDSGSSADTAGADTEAPVGETSRTDDSDESPQEETGQESAESQPETKTPPAADEQESPVETEASAPDDDVDAFFAEPSQVEKEPMLLSPVVRKLIRENDLDVSQISGSGQGGRITRRDVETFIEEGGTAPASTEDEPETPAAEERTAAEPPAAEAIEEPKPATKPAPSAAGTGSEEVELDRLRVRIAENNIKAKQTAAHVWTSIEVDFERVERVRQGHKEAFKAEEGFSLTYLPFISRAVIDALKTYPVVNSSFNLEKKTATFFKKVDLGIAIDLNQEGLVVARVRNADGLRLVGIAREIAALADTAREGELGIDDLTGSTFTITNPGPFGSFMSAPIINVPNVAILSTDTITKRPTVVTSPDGQDMIAIRHIGYLGLSWDHRAFDGSTAVLFLNRIKENIETWDWEQELA
ncbi:MAG TPA: dihydrolipoamide acetyltransferase family protein [Acidimicrobiia bacterium]|nr:dihydrolipoamide acetyltransferase family protein [Acidimicrobiia bacterium]